MIARTTREIAREEVRIVAYGWLRTVDSGWSVIFADVAIRKNLSKRSAEGIASELRIAIERIIEEARNSPAD